MKTIADIEQLNKIVRAQLIKQTELEGKYVLNSLSVYGEDLDKLLSKSTYNSYDQNDSFLLFELRSRNNGTNVSYTDENDIIYYRSYTLYIIMYGNSSSTLANKLAGRMRTAKVRNDLENEGVYIEVISDPDKINEYKNESMWIRNDISIDISCKMKITQIDNYSDFTMGSLNIIK